MATIAGSGFLAQATARTDSGTTTCSATPSEPSKLVRARHTHVLSVRGPLPTGRPAASPTSWRLPVALASSAEPALRSRVVPAADQRIQCTQNESRTQLGSHRQARLNSIVEAHGTARSWRVVTFIIYIYIIIINDQMASMARKCGMSVPLDGN